MKRTGSTQCVKRREVFRTIHSNTFKLLHFGHCLYFLHILQLPSPQAASKLIHMSSICHLGAPCLKQTGCAAFFPECELYFQTHRNVSCRVLWRVPPILLSDMLAGSFLHLKWLLQRRNIEKRWCTSDTSSPPQHQPTCFQACKEVRWDTGSCVYGFDRKQDERERGSDSQQRAPGRDSNPGPLQRGQSLCTWDTLPTEPNGTPGLSRSLWKTRVTVSATVQKMWHVSVPLTADREWQ